MNQARWIGRLGPGALCGLLMTASAAEALTQSPQDPPRSMALEQNVVAMPDQPGDGAFQLAPPQVSNASAGLTIVLNENAALAANTAASQAFRRAADTWESLLADPVTIVIDAGLESLADSSVIGSTLSVRLTTSDYSLVRNTMINDEANEVGRVDPIVGHLPTLPSFWVPVNIDFDPGDGSTSQADFSVDGVSANKAALKALGFDAGNLDTQFGVTDATINFNSDFAFDYDASDGITPGTMDFETVALHEIGHALGFTSTADVVDQLIGTDFLAFRDELGDIRDELGDLVEQLDITVAPSTLDLFRFPSGDPENPDDEAEFESLTRTLFPGDPAVTDFISNEYAMSTGVFVGDGRQASHWRDDVLGSFIGLMDPTLPTGAILPITAADLQALDVIGWDVVPEPGTLLLVLAGVPLVLRRRQRAS